MTKNETSGPGQALFDHEPIAGRAELPFAHRVDDRALRGGAVLGDHDALARRETVGLQHDRQAELAAADRRERVVERFADAEARGRHAVPRHERLRERLARFEPRGRGGRSEQQPAVRAEAIGDAQAQRQFGTDDGEVDLLAFGERQRRRPGRRGRRARCGRAGRYPGFPGATRISPTSRSEASLATSACSRAPLPRTRTLIR